MNKPIIYLIATLFLNACTSPGVINATPLVASPATSANITIHRAIDQGALFDNLVFSIDGVDTYRFDDSDNFKFVLPEGNYIFAYKHGLFAKTCTTAVEIQAGINYIFNLEPDCTIELE